jgi:proline iminopeptidase
MLPTLLAMGFLAQTPAVRYVQVDGLKIAYEVQGEGKPLLILAGGPGMTADYMRPVFDHLSKGHRCILLHQRGTGKSQVAKLDPALINLKGALADLEAVRKDLGLEKWSVLGHSWGGMLAMAYAADYSQRLDDLVLVSSGGMTMDFYVRFGDNMRLRLTPEDNKKIAEWKAKAAEDPDKAALEDVKARAPAYFYDRATGERFAESAPKDLLTRGLISMMLGDLRKSAYDLRPALDKLNTRTFIIQGRQDLLGESVSYEIHMALRNSQLAFLEKCGHFPWLEQEEKFYAAVERFLAAK